MDTTMIQRNPVLVIAAFVAALTTGCDGDLFGVSHAQPSAPGDLRAVGSRGNIHLEWADSAGAIGYLVYRSSDGAQFDRRTTHPVADTHYDDPIESPAGDGVLYHYRVTAVAEAGAAESSPSGTVHTMHGTRLAVSYPGGFSTQLEGSPYVADAIATTLGGDLWVAPGTQLHVMEGATLDFESGRGFFVSGLVRAVGSAQAPVTFTAHKTGIRYPADGDGFFFAFDGTPFEPTDGSGSVLDHVQMTNLAEPPGGSDLRSTFRISGSGIAIENTKLSVNGNSALRLTRGGWVILRNCWLDGILVAIETDLRQTAFEVTRTIVRGGSDSARRFGAESVVFSQVESPAVTARQIEGNNLDGSGIAHLDRVTGTAAIPIGGNYWSNTSGNPGHLPFVFQDESTATLDFNDPSPFLGTPPSDAGPDW
jgi:hypothetical protein